MKRYDCCIDVGVDMFEVTCATTAVPDAAVIEAHDCESGRREVTSQQHELPMAANAVLRPANDDKHTSAHRVRRMVEHADQLATVTVKYDG